MGIKEDLKLLRDVCVDGRLKRLIIYSFKNLKFDKNTKLFFLILALAFCSGWFIASLYYTGKCNAIIVENVAAAINHTKENCFLMSWQ